MNHDQVTVVLQTYAKFHSISLAMKQLEPEKFVNLTCDLDDIWINFKYVFDAQNYFDVLFQDVLNLLKAKGRPVLVLKYKLIQDDMDNIVYVKMQEADRLIISHGDSWINNMHFRNDVSVAPLYF